MVAGRPLTVLGSLSNESVERVDHRAQSLGTEDEEGATEEVEVVENAARDVIDAVEDVAEYVADWIGDAAEDVRDREGHRRSRGRWKSVESATSSISRSSGGRPCRVAKTGAARTSPEVHR